MWAVLEREDPTESRIAASAAIIFLLQPKSGIAPLK
jgi:hypothetical protein